VFRAGCPGIQGHGVERLGEGAGVEKGRVVRVEKIQNQKPEVVDVLMDRLAFADEDFQEH